MRLEKIRGMRERFLIGQYGGAPFLTVLQHHAEIEMRQGQFRIMFERAPVAVFSIAEAALIVMQESQIDMGVRQTGV